MAETQYQVPSHPGHAGRLTYAKPQDLPSFPSSGLSKDGAAAGAAASLGWANQKSVDLWKPDKSASASAAAVLAKDYKMAPQWQPDSSSAGAKAALLATASAKRQQQEQQASSAASASLSRSKSSAGTDTSSWGNSAATQAAAAMKQSSSATASPPPSSTANYGSSAATSAFRTMSVRRPAQTPVQSTAADSRKEGSGSLSAAQSAMPARRRPRAVSTPVMKDSYPGESNAAANALSAATAAHGPSTTSKSSGDRGAVPYTALPRSMFTANPKIGPEAEDEKKADLLHASAVAMAKQMYSHQQKMATQTKNAYADDGDSVDDNAPRPYVNLQEAAYKLAQERLSKLEEEHKGRRYQEYYSSGEGGMQRRNTLQRRFTMKGRLRRRSSSDSDMEEGDRERSEKIRQQMSIFSNNLSKVDEQKRTKDRQAVLEAAQRNVRARLQGMDDKVYAETGKLPPPRKLSEWELKAHEAAQAMHESRNEHKGKVNMGGGMFMSPEDVDAIATKKVQPVLDEINEKAAVERERQEILRSEAEAKKRDEEKKKERDREIKEINKKIRDQEKAEERERREAEKQEQKAKKDEEKAIKAEEKRLAKEEKRKSKAAATAAGHTDAGHESDSDENEPVQESMSHVHPQPLDTQHESPTSPHEPKSPKEAGSPTHKVKSWLKSRFHRPRGKSGSSEHDKGFVGGAALSSRANESSTSLDNRAASMREMAEAGRGRGQTVDGRGSTRDRDVSPLSSEDGDIDRAGAERTITPPAKIRDPNEDKGSPSRDSKFRENLE